MKTYNIGISCIGCRGGQSVIVACRLSRLPIKTIGFGTNPFAYGAYDCDMYDYTPSIYSDNYVDEIIKKCHEHKIDLFIPVIDDEVLLLAKNSDKLKNAGVNVILSGINLVSICREKERISMEFKGVVDAFVKCYNKDTLDDDISSGKVVFPFIAKPRGGSGSRGIEIIRSEDDLYKINEDHIIQELAIPQQTDPNYEFYMQQISKNKNPQVSEISIQVVIGNDGELLGRMSSYNKLDRGIPIEIVPYENIKIWKVIDKLLPVFMKLGLKGPLNIQGRMTDRGLKLFEMNPRFTDITGLRALLGFNEVEACIKSWLNINNEKSSININKGRVGIRQLANRAISINRNQEVSLLSEKVNGGILKEKKVILVTGAGGYLGQNFINTILREDLFEIYAFDLEKNKIIDLFDSGNISFFDKKDIESGKLSFGNIDILLHLGFAGSHSGNSEIADSTRLTVELFTWAVHNHVPSIINISSQSVYGLRSVLPCTEENRIAPETVYAQAKYSTEVMLENLRRINNYLRFTSLRLSLLSGGQKGIVPVELICKYCQKALRGETIKIDGVNQSVERLDVRDAVSAIISVIKSDPLIWKPVYNLGSGNIYNVTEIAEKVVERAKLETNEEADIEVKPVDLILNSGMDSSLFENDFCWKPKHDIDSLIDSLVRYLNTNECFV